MIQAYDMGIIVHCLVYFVEKNVCTDIYHRTCTSLSIVMRYSNSRYLYVDPGYMLTFKGSAQAMTGCWCCGWGNSNSGSVTMVTYSIVLADSLKKQQKKPRLYPHPIPPAEPEAAVRHGIS